MARKDAQWFEDDARTRKTMMGSWDDRAGKQQRRYSYDNVQNYNPLYMGYHVPSLKDTPILINPTGRSTYASQGKKSGQSLVDAFYGGKESGKLHRNNIVSYKDYSIDKDPYFRRGLADSLVKSSYGGRSQMPYIITEDGKLHPNPWRSDFSASFDDPWKNLDQVHNYDKYGYEGRKWKEGEMQDAHQERTWHKAQGLNFNTMGEASLHNLNYALQNDVRAIKPDLNSYQFLTRSDDGRSYVDHGVRIHERPEYTNWDLTKQFYFTPYEKINKRMRDKFGYTLNQNAKYTADAFYKPFNYQIGTELPDYYKPEQVTMSFSGGRGNAVFNKYQGLGEHGYTTQRGINELDRLFDQGSNQGRKDVQMYGLEYNEPSSTFKPLEDTFKKVNNNNTEGTTT